MRSQIVNFLLYQVGWLACVCGAAQNRPGLGLASASTLLLGHLILSYDRSRQLTLIFVAAIIGLSVESVLSWVGVYQFTSGQPVSWLPPPWIIIMWMQFATLLPFCLSWLRSRYLLSAFLGMTGGPLAFLGGESLGAIIILPPRWSHMILLALFWSLAMPVLLYATDRLFGATRIACSYRWISKKTSSREIAQLKWS